jgi:glycogen synthase
MRILIISNLFPPDVIGGYELGCFRIARSLAEQGHTVVVATSEARSGKVSAELDKNLQVRRVFRPVWDFEVRPQLDQDRAYRSAKLLRMLVADIPSAVTLRRLLDAEPTFDVAYLFNLVGLGPLSLIETLLAAAVPSVVHLMDNFDSLLQASVRSIGLLSRYAQLKKQLAAIACSEACLQRNSVIGSYQEAQVVFSGVERLPDGGCSHLEPAPGVFRFVYTGQIVAHKGINELIEAFQRVVAAVNDPVELHLIGGIQQGYEQELHERAATLIETGHIFVHGARSHADVLACLRSMDLGVYPLSDIEAFGYAPIECLASGVPAIISRKAGCCEMLPANYPLFVSTRYDVGILADAMLLGFRHKEMRELALTRFVASREAYAFESYTLPRIEVALGGVSGHRAGLEFPAMLQQYRTIVDHACLAPSAVFNSM